MLKKSIITLLGLFLALTPLLAVEKINGAGATFPYPVYSAWAFLYQREAKTQINYQSIGSGGGVRQIDNRTVDFGASDAPLTPEIQNEKKLLQFPAVIGGVVPVVNLPGLKNKTIKLTGEQLADIFLGKIVNWSDPALKKNNEGFSLPDEKITVVHRSDGSGTTAIFTTYLDDVSKDWTKDVGKGKAVKWPVGIGGKGNEGVANYIKRVKNSIGYVEFAYAKQNKLHFVELKNKAGNYVSPSIDSFKDAASHAQWEPQKGFYLWLTNAPGTKSWPIAGATFILLAKEKKENNRKVVTFFDWAFNKGDAVAEKLTYVPLPDNLKETVRTYWKSNGIN